MWAYILAKTRYQSFVIIGRYKAAIDIMEKEGAPFSDRPRSVAGGEIVTGNVRIAMISEDKHRHLRSLLTPSVGPFILTSSPKQLQHTRVYKLDMHETLSWIFLMTQ